MSFALPSSEEKAAYVLDQFDRIASKYDQTNDVISLGMHRLWKREAVKLLVADPDAEYLDVCCGTGDLTEQISKSLKSGRVVGLDFSTNMLAVAKRRQERFAKSNQTSFQQGDALNLPFESDRFAGAVISFGLRNLVSYEAGIKEMARVVRPGGKVINLDLGKSTTPVFAEIFALYFRHVVPMIGELIQSDKKAYTYLPVSASAYPAPPGITKIFENAGLKNIRYIPLALGTVALHVGEVVENHGLKA